MRLRRTEHLKRIAHLCVRDCLGFHPFTCVRQRGKSSECLSLYGELSLCIPADSPIFQVAKDPTTPPQAPAIMCLGPSGMSKEELRAISVNLWLLGVMQKGSSIIIPPAENPNNEGQAP